VTRHNFYQRRTRLLNELQQAHLDYIWYMNETAPMKKRAATLAARRIMESSRALWKLQSGRSTISACAGK